MIRASVRAHPPQRAAASDALNDGLPLPAVVSIITFPLEMLTAMSLLYITLLPFGMRSYCRHKAEYKQRKAEAM